ncbi:MAG TPA: aminotransferase class I/II-fold pyridoxal phosphate-dependent enzyme [Planctomycetota bacterium]|nr:aminotransferase class I/II-fold pyridoxal phosphate-dependent enzyme [Planctomycetota bacterium]
MTATTVRATMLPFSRPSIGEDEIREVTEVLRSGWITTGPRTVRFEKDFAAYVGAKHALALSSGTAALHCAYWALDLKPGDEILCPSLTWPATANMAVALGAKVVFADIDRDTRQIDPKDVSKKITKKTRAIVPVHFAGAPADIDALKAIAGKKIKIIEDAAHAAGTEYKGRRIGSHGNAAIYSFHPIKDITTGEGGMLTTDDDKLAERVKLFKFHGVSRDAWKAYGSAATAHYDTVVPGFKYNLTDIASALGIHQLRRLDGFIDRRRAIAEKYLAALDGVEGLGLPAAPAYPHRHAWHLFTVLVGKRDEFMAKLKEQNIGSGLHFEAVHRTSLYKKGAKKLPQTDHVCSRILSLPLFPDMTDQDADDVVAAVRRLLA